MNWGLITLIVLVLVIVLGFYKKLNVGVLAIAAAVPLGKLAGMNDKAIMAGWNTSLSLMLMGVTLVFSIAQSNGTLELFARKVISSTGKKAWMIPIVIFFLSAFLAAVGPGTVPVMTLMVPLAVALAVEMEISPVMIAPITVLGSCAGGLTPIAPTGIIGLTLMADQGFKGLELPYALSSFFTEFFVAAILYVAFRGYRLRATKDSTAALPAFNANQKITMLGMVVMIVVVLITRINVGLVAFIVGAALLGCKVVDERAAIRNMPWSTIILVCGVGVLMNLAIKLKGIALLAKTLGGLMTAQTADPVMAITAGVMSWFSSTSGVVMPTLIPTIGGLLQTVPGTTPLELLSAITFGSHTAGISPASTGGALALAAYAASTGISSAQQNKLFMEMFATAVVGVLLVALYAVLGGFGWLNGLVAA